MVGDVDPEFTHSGNRFRIYETRLVSRTHDLEAIARDIAEEGLGHLGAARIFGAKKQDFRFDGHRSSTPLLTDLGDLGGLDRLVPSAAFGIKKPEQFL